MRPWRAAALVLAAMVLAAPAAADSLTRGITVQGEGRIAARPDMVLLHAGVSHQAPTAKAALAGHTAGMAKLLAALKDFGLADRDIQTRQIRLQPIFARRKRQDDNPAPIAFRASGDLRLRLRQVDRAGDLLDRLAAAGSNTLSGLQFPFAEPRALQDRARQTAIADARRRAELYAREAGVSLGPVLQIREGGGMVQMREFRAMAADRGAAIAPGENEIRIGVTVVFAIE